MHNIKCSRCGRRAKYIDPFHPWENDYTVCEQCFILVKEERELRATTHVERQTIFPQNQVVSVKVKPPQSSDVTWLQTICSWLKSIMN